MAFNTSSPLPLMERLRRRGQSGGGDEVSHDGDRQRKKRKQTPPGGTAAPASRTERGKKVGKKKAKVKGKADGKTKSDATVNWWSGQLPAVTDLDEGIPEGARHAAAACVAIEKLSPDETLLEEASQHVSNQHVSTSRSPHPPPPSPHLLRVEHLSYTTHTLINTEVLPDQHSSRRPSFGLSDARVWLCGNGPRACRIPMLLLTFSLRSPHHKHGMPCTTWVADLF